MAKEKVEKTKKNADSNYEQPEAIYVKLITGGYYSQLDSKLKNELMQLVKQVRPEWEHRTIMRHFRYPINEIPDRKKKIYYEILGDCLAQMLQKQVTILTEDEQKTKLLNEIISEYLKRTEDENETQK